MHIATSCTQRLLVKPGFTVSMRSLLSLYSLLRPAPLPPIAAGRTDHQGSAHGDSPSLTSPRLQNPSPPLRPPAHRRRFFRNCLLVGPFCAAGVDLSRREFSLPGTSANAA